jgi:hypothetical protein
MLIPPWFARLIVQGHRGWLVADCNSDQANSGQARVSGKRSVLGMVKTGLLAPQKCLSMNGDESSRLEPKTVSPLT